MHCHPEERSDEGSAVALEKQNLQLAVDTAKSRNISANRAIIRAMFSPKLFISQNVGRTQIMSNLYGSIVLLASFSLCLGMQLSSLARDLGRGDPYHVVRWTELATCSALVAVIGSAFGIHQWIQRLAKLGGEQKTDSESR
jgi:TctA family transporter